MIDNRLYHDYDEPACEIYAEATIGDELCSCDVCEVAYRAVFNVAAKDRPLFCWETTEEVRQTSGPDGDCPTWEVPIITTEHYAQWYEHRLSRGSRRVNF